MTAREERRVQGGFGVLLLIEKIKHVYKLRGSSSIERENKDEGERQDELIVMMSK